jgi:hypothetical protein
MCVRVGAVMYICVLDSERSCIYVLEVMYICVIEVMYMCVRGIDFAFLRFVIGLWNSSNNMNMVLFFNLFLTYNSNFYHNP